MKLEYNKKIILNNIDDTKDFAKAFAKTINKHCIVSLIGDLGSGKTLFVKEVCKFFKINNEIVSPTFNILKSYQIKNHKNLNLLNHFDVYRIKSNEELDDIGFYDYIYDDKSINFIEWGDLIKDSLPKETICIYFLKDNNNINKREVIIKC